VTLHDVEQTSQPRSLTAMLIVS